MKNIDKPSLLQDNPQHRAGNQRILLSLWLVPLLLFACTLSFASVPTTPVPDTASPTALALPTATQIPTLAPLPSPTPIPTETSIPSDPPNTIAMDFVALLCNADWMNGTRHLSACPAANADHSGGYAAKIDPAAESLPANTPVLLMVPNANALFLRYPAFQVNPGDRFRTTLLCAKSAPCDVQFALEYYDGSGKYHEFLKWDYKTGDDPIAVDADLGALAGQKVDLVPILRLFHVIASPQHDNGLWVAPRIYRPNP